MSKADRMEGTQRVGGKVVGKSIKKLEKEGTVIAENIIRGQEGDGLEVEDKRRGDGKRRAGVFSALWQQCLRSCIY